MSKNHLNPLLNFIKCSFPEAYAEISEKNLISKNLFSPFTIELPSGVFENIKEFVDLVYSVKESKDYQSQLPLPKNFENWPSTPSLLSCFDFHYTEEMGLKLIEINTNASLYLPLILQRCAQIDTCEVDQFSDLLESFIETFQLAKGDAISVFDEVPENEGLYFEFLIFKEWLTRSGYPTNIVSLENFAEKANPNVYNRFTDFYFDKEGSAQIHKDYFDGIKKFSPNPREYFLMADKRRLSPLREAIEKIKPSFANIIPETRLFSDFESKEELWAQRKKYFFKPSSSFGSKGAFSGKGISKKAFEGIYSPDFIAQELAPAGRRNFNWEGEEMEMKFDLRFFTFNGKVQNYGARLYQGQTTNMRTPFGGLAPIDFF